MAGRILVLDDEENYAEMLQDLLRGNNYQVDMATRPERAIDQLEEIPYDLVISDYKMPVMDGADFLKRARELYPNLPFILVSGLMNTPELVKVANMSVTLVMEKPLDTAVFLEHVARFSEPMTEEEKLAQENAQESAEDQSAGETSYPEEPCFFSAVSVPAKRFLQKAWAIAQKNRNLFILEPSGGDAELAAKDISAWRGNRDFPVASFTMPASNEEAIELVRGISSELDQSNTICVRLKDASQIKQARKLSQSVQVELGNSGNLLLVYIVEADAAASCLEELGAQAVCLPALNERPADVAAYVRRFARIACERSGKKNSTEWTPDAAYLLLAYDWPNGYRELQRVVLATVISSEGDEAIAAQSLQEAIGLQSLEIPDQASRLRELMQKAQRDYFEKEMSGLGISATELSRKLEIEPTTQTAEELKNLALLKGDLANL